jgi:hypothetical protein
VRSGKERVGGSERRRERSKGAVGAGEEVEGKAERRDGARGSAWRWEWGSVGRSEDAKDNAVDDRLGGISH